MENLINTTILGPKNPEEETISVSELLLEIFTTQDPLADVDSYEGDLEDGKGTSTDQDGKYEGDLEDGKKHGYGTMNYTNGDRYVGEWENGKKHGYGTMNYTNGDRYYGDWKDNKREGQGTCFDAHGNYFEGEWEDDKEHGQGTMQYTNGRYFEGKWKNGEIIVESTKTKEENKTQTLLLRSEEIDSENRPLKYENDKFLDGDEKVEVVVCKDKDRVLAKINKFIEKNQDKDKCRIVFNQHGVRGGVNDMGIDKDCAEEILESLAGKFKDIIISDHSCYGATAKHFVEVAQSVAILKEVNIKLRFAPQDGACLAVLKEHDGNLMYSIATIGRDGSLEKRKSIEFLKDGTVILKYQDGSKYVGGWENGEKNGQGTYTFADGSSYEGQFKDSKFHGQGTLTNKDGSKYVGGWKDDKKNGQGTLTYQDGTERYKGEWENDKFHGQGTYTLTDGSSYEGQFKDSKFHGQGILTYKDGNKYVGEWENNKKHGQGKYTLADGSCYEGKWKNGQKEGQGKSSRKDGSEYVGEWKDGKPHGEGTYIDADGDRYEGEWKNGQREGLGRVTLKDGSIFDDEWIGDNMSLPNITDEEVVAGKIPLSTPKKTLKPSQEKALTNIPEGILHHQ
jgi:hypothetical protein